MTIELNSKQFLRFLFFNVMSMIFASNLFALDSNCSSGRSTVGLQSEETLSFTGLVSLDQDTSYLRLMPNGEDLSVYFLFRKDTITEVTDLVLNQKLDLKNIFEGTEGSLTPYTIAVKSLAKAYAMVHDDQGNMVRQDVVVNESYPYGFLQAAYPNNFPKQISTSSDEGITRGLGGCSFSGVCKTACTKCSGSVTSACNCALCCWQ